MSYTDKQFHLSQLQLALKTRAIAQRTALITLLVSLGLAALSFRVTGIYKRSSLLVGSLVLLYASRKLSDLDTMANPYESIADIQSKQSYQGWLEHSFKSPSQSVELVAPTELQQLTEVKFAPIETALRKPHLMILGETGSGKSTLCKYLVSQVNAPCLIIDPHASPTDWIGFKVIGAGRKYTDIATEFKRLADLMQSRYEQRDKGVTNFEPLIIIIDEFPAIASALGKDATNTVKLLAREARKVQMRLCLLSQGSEVKTLGLEGEGSIRESFAMLRLGNFALNHAKLLKDNQIIDAVSSGDRPAMLGSYPCNLPTLPESQSLPVLPMPSDYLALIGESSPHKQLPAATVNPADVWDEPAENKAELAPVLKKILQFLDGRDWTRDNYIKASIREFKDANTPLVEIQGYLQWLEVKGCLETRHAGRDGIEARLKAS